MKNYLRQIYLALVAFWKPHRTQAD